MSSPFKFIVTIELWALYFAIIFRWPQVGLWVAGVGLTAFVLLHAWYVAKK